MTQQEDGQLPTHEIVAAEVRAELARQRISGRQAARRLGWTQQALSRRLNGDIPFNVADLDALAGLLEVPISAFFPQNRMILKGVRTAPIRSSLPPEPELCAGCSTDSEHCYGYAAWCDCPCVDWTDAPGEALSLCRSVLGLAA